MAIECSQGRRPGRVAQVSCRDPLILINKRGLLTLLAQRGKSTSADNFLTKQAPTSHHPSSPSSPPPPLCVLMTSGFGFRGNQGRCHPLWLGFNECLDALPAKPSRAEARACLNIRDDYYEFVISSSSFSFKNLFSLLARESLHSNVGEMGELTACAVTGRVFRSGASTTRRKRRATSFLPSGWQSWEASFLLKSRLRRRQQQATGIIMGKYIFSTKNIFCRPNVYNAQHLSPTYIYIHACIYNEHNKTDTYTHAPRLSSIFYKQRAHQPKVTAKHEM